ncbi:MULTISPECIES: hypothetical protein [Serratia]|uniref:hypothetical protein n=1 Tax=Serratia TaxID=613 RepID=UPI0018D2A20A|nr:hypothetical protein [Serratia ureilytica]EIY8600048.1 hypothetical protein [Serratia marcescens]EIY8858223.1 hypothetical protein [Serratia marcescens]EIY8867771.1 hypothetical protein [Serratia marcescens]EIY9018480.1 hypothetical protein [Serratia marcescens]MBH1928051.1 hypothetical protein [Serratia ureilytica]
MEKQPGGLWPFPVFLPSLHSLTFAFLSPPLAAVLTSAVCQREEAEVHLKLMCRTVIAGLLLTMQDRQRVPV